MQARAMTILLSVAVLIASCATGPVVGGAIAQLGPPPDGKTRLVFYGTNDRWSGLLGEPWEPTVSINGQRLAMPKGSNIVFYTSVDAGPLQVSAGGKPVLDFEAKAGRVEWIRMEAMETPLAMAGYRLDLRRVDPEGAERITRQFRYEGETRLAE